MLKQLFLLALVLTVTLDLSAAGRGGGGKKRGGGGGHGGGGSHGGRRPPRVCNNKCGREDACAITYPNGTSETLDTCDDGLVCNASPDLTVSLGTDDYGIHFCNETFELQTGMACKLENAAGEEVCRESPCLVGACDAGPEDVVGKDNVTYSATFCGSVPTDFNYGSEALKRACGIYDGETQLRSSQCRDPDNRRGRIDCPETNPLTVPYQGQDLTVYYCDSDVDVAEIFDGHRGRHRSGESSSSESDSNSSEPI